MKLENTTHIHFIGIGGIGMSALARLFLHEGKIVSGSDVAESENTKKLEAEGARISYAQVAENIKKSNTTIDLVVYTEAMAQDHPELVAARDSGSTTINYFEALGMVANEYYLIAVSGTHGKTTTTAMLADIFEAADLDPSVVVGSLRSKTGSNYRAGKSKYFIVEACEYKRDFLHLKPDVLVITNLEHEHVDYYRTLADVQDAFKVLAAHVPASGAIIASADDPHIVPVLEGVSAPVIDYKHYVEPLLTLRQPGLHNTLNAAAATAVAAHEGVDAAITREALMAFEGTWRRFEYVGDINGAPVHDEYAHHPTEVAAAIATARAVYPGTRLTIVFQPHTYSRTQGLFDDFVQVLTRADTVVCAPIYAAREATIPGVSSALLAQAVVDAGGNAEYIDTFEAIVAHVSSTVSDTDVVMVMGAGDITQVTKQLTNMQ